MSDDTTLETETTAETSETNTTAETSDVSEVLLRMEARQNEFMAILYIALAFIILKVILWDCFFKEA